MNFLKIREDYDLNPGTLAVRRELYTTCAAPKNELLSQSCCMIRSFLPCCQILWKARGGKKIETPVMDWMVVPAEKSSQLSWINFRERSNYSYKGHILSSIGDLWCVLHSDGQKRYLSQGLRGVAVVQGKNIEPQIQMPGLSCRRGKGFYFCLIKNYQYSDGGYLWFSKIEYSISEQSEDISCGQMWFHAQTIISKS